MPLSLLRRTRLEKGLTLDDIFLKTQMTQPRLSKLERGIYKPKPEEKRLLAEAYGVSERDLFPPE